MEEEEILAVGYEDGEWHKPYYDCGGGNIWMMTYTVPFFGFNHVSNQYYFKYANLVIWASTFSLSHIIWIFRQKNFIKSKMNSFWGWNPLWTYPCEICRFFPLKTSNILKKIFTNHLRGTSGLDIDLRVVDINQCHANTSSFNIFGGTDKCKKETTTVKQFIK